MSVNQTKVFEARNLAEEIETLCLELELLVNGKEGFLKDLRKITQDIGVQRFNEDIFLLKNLSKHVLEIMNHIQKMNDDDNEEEHQFNREQYDKSKSVY